MQVISSILEVKAKCDTVIEIVDHFDNTQTYLSTLLAIDTSWETHAQVLAWFVGQVKRQVAAFDRLQVWYHGFTFVLKFLTFDRLS